MKFRILFLSVFAVALGAAGWYAYSGCSLEAVTTYVPRSEFNETQGIKGAMEYYKLVRANIYTGEIEREDVINTRNAVQEISRQGVAKDADLTWSSMGPVNVGGRTRGLTSYPNDPNTLLAGGISGGLFRSTNGGGSWTLLTGFQDAIGVSSIAILENGHIYVATGHSREGFTSGGGGSEFMGSGLYVSTDDGASFNIVSDFEPQIWNPGDDWAVTNIIAADPSNPSRLWVGTNFGLYPYIDGEMELGSLPNGLFPQLTQDFVISSSGQNIMVAVGTRTFVSTDFGENFTQVNDDVNTFAGSSTIDLAVAPYNEDIFFSSVAAPNGRLKGIYATLDAGQTWNEIAPSNVTGTSLFAPFSTTLSQQGNYDNMITVVPTGSGEDFNVIMGGIVLYRWQSPSNVTPGITLWENINANFASAPGLPPSPLYVHSDIHESHWTSDGTLYLGTDGGIFKTTDNGQTWSTVNFNYSTTQYYSIAFSPSGQTLGGLQDNGTLWLSLQAGNPGLARQFTGGDGFACAISQEFPDYMFSTIYNGEVFRSTDGGTNVANLGNLMEVSNGGGSDFFTDIALYENPDNQFSEIFVQYTPTIDDPNLVFYEDYVVTADGDTIIGEVPAETVINIDASNSDFILTDVLDEPLYFYSYYVRTVGNNEFVYHNVGDTTFVQETPQFMMAAPLSNGVYITREPMKTNGVPQWYPLSEDNGSPSSVEFSPDGDHLYVGYSSGQLVRYSGLNNAWTGDELNFDEPEFEITKDIIYSGSGVVTDIEVDYSMGQGTAPGAEPASERVAISIGNYGGNSKIRVSNDAATTATNTSFQNIWNVEPGIVGMPCYSVVMDVADPNKLLAGTEYGIWYTDNNGEDWVNVNNGEMVRVPVYGLRQQKLPNWKVENSGVVYAGTHGRGVFKSDYFFNAPNSIEDTYTAVEPLSDLIIFPNPAADIATLKYSMGTPGNVTMRVFSLDGRLVDSKVGQPVEAGRDRLMTINVADLPTGTYLVQLSTDKESKTVKFVKSN
jgi:photosystem II stability/assembly factor-like uncharacterized protein